MPTWILLIDADMSISGWQYTAINTYDLLRIEQSNLPQIGRFQLAQVEDVSGTFVTIDSYPSSNEVVQITPEVATNLDRKFAIKAGYIQTENDTPTTWRVKVYGAVSDFVPPVNPSLAILKFDARIAGAIPIEEKGVAYGVAELGSDGKVKSTQLPPQQTTDLTTVNNRLTTLEGINAASRLSVIEALNGGSRLTALEAINTASRLVALEGINAGTRLTALEALPVTEFPNFHLHVWGLTPTPTGKTFLSTMSSSNDLNRYAVLDPAANGDAVEYELPLKAGNYRIALYGQRNTTRGISVIYFDGKYLGQFDWYNGGLIARVVNQIFFSVATSGMHVVKVAASPSSGGVSLALSMIAIIATGGTKQIREPIRINCGATTEYTDPSGNLFTRDFFGVGATAYPSAYTGAIDLTTADPLYQSERSTDSGTFTYTLPLTIPGTYQLKLHFCENYFDNGEYSTRPLGTVALNGTNILTNFSIFNEAGGQHKALIKTFSNLALTNQCVLTFTNTLINAIELI